MRNSSRSLMLFSAGLGTRMKHLTHDRPKPLIEVAGKPLIDHALEQIDAFDVGRIVVNLHYKPEMLEAHLNGRSILFSDERAKILETGGGLRAAIPLLGTDPVFTMNTDAIWSGPNPLAHLDAHWDPDRMDALLLCIPQKHASGHHGKGDFVADETGQAKRGPGMIYSGLQIIKTDLLSDIPEEAFSLNRLWDRMLDDKRLYTLAYRGQWCDVGHPENITTAEKLLRGTFV